MSHNHLHPKEVGLIRMLQVLVWSEDKELEVQARQFLFDEFGEYIFLLNVDEMSVLESLDPSKYHEELDKYDFHLIRLSNNKAELVFRDESKAERVEREFEDLEMLLEEYGRLLISYYHKHMEDD
mgnify:CR=1 FL=1